MKKILFGSLATVGIIGSSVFMSPQANAVTVETDAATTRTASACSYYSWYQNWSSAELTRFKKNHYLSTHFPYRYGYNSSSTSYKHSVRHIQIALCRKGYSLTLDGSYGPATRNAVIAWQRRAGLSADGVVGSNTARSLRLWWTSGSVTTVVGDCSVSGCV